MRAGERCACESRRVSEVERLTFGHILDIAHEGVDVVVAGGDVADIGDRQSESGAREQIAERADIGERDHVRGCPLTGFAFGSKQTGAQFVQGSGGEHNGEENAIGLEGLANLREAAGQIIDPVERQDAGDEIEALRTQGQGFFIGDEGGGLICEAREVPSEVGLEPVFDFLRLGERCCAMPSYVERGVEVARDEVQSFGHVFGEMIKEEATRGVFAPGNFLSDVLAAAAHEAAVKYRAGIGHNQRAGSKGSTGSEGSK